MSIYVCKYVIIIISIISFISTVSHKIVTYKGQCGGGELRHDWASFSCRTRSINSWWVTTSQRSSLRFFMTGWKKLRWTLKLQCLSMLERWHTRPTRRSWRMVRCEVWWWWGICLFCWFIVSLGVNPSFQHCRGFGLVSWADSWWPAVCVLWTHWFNHNETVAVTLFQQVALRH